MVQPARRSGKSCSEWLRIWLLEWASWRLGLFLLLLAVLMLAIAGLCSADWLLQASMASAVAGAGFVALWYAWETRKMAEQAERSADAAHQQLTLDKLPHFRLYIAECTFTVVTQDAIWISWGVQNEGPGMAIHTVLDVGIEYKNRTILCRSLELPRHNLLANSKLMEDDWEFDIDEERERKHVVRYHLSLRYFDGTGTRRITGMSYAPRTEWHTPWVPYRWNVDQDGGYKLDQSDPDPDICEREMNSDEWKVLLRNYASRRTTRSGEPLSFV